MTTMFTAILLFDASETALSAFFTFVTDFCLLWTSIIEEESKIFHVHITRLTRLRLVNVTDE
jgi:hypothetical protein